MTEFAIIRITIFRHDLLSQYWMCFQHHILITLLHKYKLLKLQVTINYKKFLLYIVWQYIVVT